ncbi:MAG: hypothetical protein AD742_09775 [Methylibium sp. NZG]|nr:MAG: hypothetical protein AD742_09775 [Methylibium sp. NZG]
MKLLVTRWFMLASVVGSVAAFAVARALGGPLEAVVLAAGGVVLVAAAVLERVAPFRKAWNEPAGDTATDVVSTAVLLGLVDPLLKAVMPVLVVALLWASAEPNPALFGADLPFGLQVVLALLWLELAAYASHRWHHADRRLWWLHAMHHSSQRLYLLNGFRFHPLNRAINQALGTLPLLWLGAPADVLLACLAITQPVLILQHANIDLRSGCLNRVFSSNEVHRWHHSSATHEAHSNFGSSLLVWDHVFGTYKPAGADTSLIAIGLFDDGGRYPAARSYWQQLTSMFSPSCCAAQR